MLPKEPMKNSVFSKNEIGSEILGVSATPTFLTEPKNFPQGNERKEYRITLNAPFKKPLIK